MYKQNSNQYKTKIQNKKDIWQLFPLGDSGVLPIYHLSGCFGDYSTNTEQKRGQTARQKKIADGIQL